jgi:ligand-binding SRPBCC domain-containing protein
MSSGLLRRMKVFNFQSETCVPRRRSEVFPFFAEARNLQTLTPPWLKFEVLTPAPIVLRSGTLIDYQITVHGLPIRWRTEIAEWDPPHRFVDVQLSGPYTLWHHTHTFEEQDGGTLCRDRVRYRPRGGALVHWLFVRRDVERIFQYRQQRLNELFGSMVNKSVAAGATAP